MKKQLRTILLCIVLNMGALIGIPMRPEEIEELMHSINQPKIAQTMSDETDKDDEIIRKLYGQGR